MWPCRPVQTERVHSGKRFKLHLDISTYNALSECFYDYNCILNLIFCRQSSAYRSWVASLSWGLPTRYSHWPCLHCPNKLLKWE
jgi:hypothetical protein